MHKRIEHSWRRGLALAAVVLAAGCNGPPPARTLSNPDPSGKIPAIEEAAHGHDRKAVPQLVKDLASDDPAVRFYAIGALRRITGTTLGYHYYDDEDARKQAIMRWEEWLAQGGKPVRE